MESVSTVEQLRAARESRGLGLDDITRQLKLAPRQIEALEAGDWAALPGLAFVRGALRGYGRVLDVDVEPLVATVASTVRAAVLHPAASLDQPLPTRSMLGFGSGGSGNRLAWLALAVALLVVIGLYLGGGQLSGMRSWLQPGATSAEGGAERGDQDKSTPDGATPSGTESSGGAAGAIPADSFAATPPATTPAGSATGTVVVPLTLPKPPGAAPAQGSGPDAGRDPAQGAR